MSWGKGGRLPRRSRRPPRSVLLAAAALVVGGCSTNHALVAVPATAATTATATTATTTAAATTVYQPTAPQASRDDAGAHLIAAWRAGDRAAAASDATPDAIAAVFAQPYPQGGVQARGCSMAPAGPSSCDYRILANGSLLELSVVRVTGGWLTQAARFLG